MINRSGLGLLVLGALLFGAVFYAATTFHVLGWPADGEDGTIAPQYLVALYTVGFGLPYAVGELARRTNWMAVLYMIVLVPAVHLGAIYAFMWYTAEGANLGAGDNAALLAGLLAGATGALLSFALIFLTGLRAAGVGAAPFAAGLVLLTACGGLSFTLLGDDPQPLDIVLRLFLPWQLIFAFFLAVLLRASPRRGAAATV